MPLRCSTLYPSTTSRNPWPHRAIVFVSARVASVRHAQSARNKVSAIARTGALDIGIVIRPSGAGFEAGREGTSGPRPTIVYPGAVRLQCGVPAPSPDGGSPGPVGVGFRGVGDRVTGAAALPFE